MSISAKDSGNVRVRLQPCHIVVETEGVLTPEASAAKAVFPRA